MAAVWIKLSNRHYTLDPKFCPKDVAVNVMLMGKRWRVRASSGSWPNRQWFDLLEPEPSDKPRTYQHVKHAKRAAQKNAMSAAVIKKAGK